MRLCTGRVVVGIDGSEAAIHAARWASDEARVRGVGLALVHVIDSADTDDSGAASDVEVSCATSLLTKASAVVHAHSPRIDVVTGIERGELVHTLADMAAEAHLLCVGVPKRGYRAEMIGSVAPSLSRSARCPVAVVPRSTRAQQQYPCVVAVAVDPEAGAAPILRFAFEEATCWNAELLVVSPPIHGRPSAGPILDAVSERFPRVAVQTECSDVGVFELLRHTGRSVRCVVVSPAGMASFRETDPPAVVVRP